jgi:hypothetical protein
MKSIQLTVTDEWVLPIPLQQLDPTTTEMYLDCLSELIADYSKKMTTSDHVSIKSNLEHEYKIKIQKLLKKHKQELDMNTSSNTSSMTYLQQQHDFLQKQLTDERSSYRDTLNNEVKNIKEEEEGRTQRKISCVERDLSDMSERLNKQRDLYEEQLSEERKNRVKDKQSLSEEIEDKLRIDIKQMYNAELSTAAITIQQLKQQLESNETNTLKQEQLYKQLLTDKDSMTTSINDTSKHIKQLSKQIQPIVKMYTGSNEEKGTAGEQTIYNLLRDDSRYESAKIFDTSGDKECGDLHFHWNGLRCLIEVKNKKTITIDDMKKFDRDVRVSKESDKSINCAIFVSLISNNFPNRSRESIQIDHINSVPVIYTYVSDLSMLQYSIICLNNIVEKVSNDSGKFKKLLCYYQAYARNVTYYNGYFRKMIKTHESSIKSLKKEMNNLSILEEELSSNVEFCNITEDLSNDDSDADVAESVTDETESVTDETDVVNEQLDLSEDGLKKSKDKVVDYFINYSLKNSRNPTVADMIIYFNITSRTLLKKLGGIKSISTIAKNKYLSNIISANVINGLMMYKIANNCYPKRPILINKFIPQRVLTKIGYVLKCKKVMETVFQFIDEYVEKDIEEEEDAEEEEEEEDDIEEDAEDAENIVDDLPPIPRTSKIFRVVSHK